VSGAKALPADTAVPMDYTAEIYRLNLTYLIAAKEALLTNGQDYAEIAFGLCEPLLSWLQRASGTEIHALAETSGMVFASRLPPAWAGERILAACSTGSQAALTARMHALQRMMFGDDARPAS
jgi:hypothetical protein